MISDSSANQKGPPDRKRIRKLQFENQPRPIVLQGQSFLHCSPKMRHESFVMSNEYESYLALHSCNSSLELCNVEILIVNDFLRFNRFRVQLFQSSCSWLSGRLVLGRDFTHGRPDLFGVSAELCSCQILNSSFGSVNFHFYLFLQIFRFLKKNLKV